MKNRKAEVDAVASSFNFETCKYQLNLSTSMGDILIDLWPDKAPGHVTNILSLAKIGYYDGLTFHRIVKGFVIQAGCPMGTGTGGPGFTIKQEFNSVPHDPGVLSMARTSDPDSAGSQFFLCIEKYPLHSSDKLLFLRYLLL
jgi:cyclophilin family peptidyl-prolyl cis-trans isomerase